MSANILLSIDVLLAIALLVLVILLVTNKQEVNRIWRSLLTVPAETRFTEDVEQQQWQ